MILCDIGNTSVDIWHDGVMRKYRADTFDPASITEEIWYASVNSRMDLHAYPHWHNIQSRLDRTRYYPTMGIDRILGCEAIAHGVIVDAGSAITIDHMVHGVYAGGMIALGLRHAQRAYGELSPALALPFNFEVDLDTMAKNTQDAITLGFLAPLIHTIAALEGDLYLCGGDAEVLKRFLPQGIVVEDIIFRGMKKVLDKEE